MTGYLFLADLACSGVLEEPTVEEIGFHVAKMKKGAWGALAELGVTLPATDDADTSILEDMAANAFVQLYRDVCTVLGEETVANLEFSPIVLEHTLCKYQRLSRKGLCNFSANSLESMIGTVAKARTQIQPTVEPEEPLDDNMDCEE